VAEEDITWRVGMVEETPAVEGEVGYTVQAGVRQGSAQLQETVGWVQAPKDMLGETATGTAEVVVVDTVKTERLEQQPMVATAALD
jgi:hypothetical protein